MPADAPISPPDGRLQGVLRRLSPVHSPVEVAALLLVVAALGSIFFAYGWWSWVGLAVLVAGCLWLAVGLRSGRARRR